MIGFVNCTKNFQFRDEIKCILDDCNFTFKSTDKVCILARGGMGKTTITRMLAGLERPSKGTVLRNDGISWPLGFTGAFHPALTGEQNIKTIADLCDVDARWAVAYAAHFSELGTDYYRPMEQYSSGMRAQLGFALSMAMPAQTYLADDKIGSGEANFRMKCEAALEKRLENAGLFYITRAPRLAERYGEIFGVLDNGKIELHDDFASAVSAFEQARDNDFADLADIAEGIGSS